MALLSGLLACSLLPPPPELGSTTPRVWDATFPRAQLRALDLSCRSRAHSFTSVFDRKDAPEGRTVIERALSAVLDELGDDSRFVEYWWRGVHKAMETHRDVDEALCRSRKHAGTGVGMQQCPDHGHVLYLDLAPDLCAPTCVWEEDASDDVWASEAAAVDADVRAGPPRSLQCLHVVPARRGRLLRFRGDLLHAVPKPACQWLGVVEEGPVADDDLRSVILFNTWSKPPLLPSSKDPPAAKAIEELAALDDPPICRSFGNWQELAAVKLSHSGEETTLDAPLLGDPLRRGCEDPSLTVSVPSEDIREALLSKFAWHSVGVKDIGASARRLAGAASSAGSSPWQASVEVNEAEEFALKIGYAEQLEADFFGVDASEGEFEETDDW
ncbi:MAG: hypothetical protein SGPRY_003434 [Prymnesium sp.]